MYHPESAGESASLRKMAHPVTCPRRGSSTPSALTAVVPTTGSSNIVPSDENQSSLFIQSPPQAVSSSPGPQHPLQTLNLLSQSQGQSQPLSLTGVQMKKKSGFQITSVTSAQVFMSSSNSAAEDTESYDDLDESHTEDLSSSEILDVSLSHATDMGGTERSSSEETLSNFHEADTPGAVSPNQPPHCPLPQALQPGTMVNGTIQHQVHATQCTVAPSGTLEGAAISTAMSSTFGVLPCAVQNLSTDVGAVTQNVSVSSTSAVGSSGTITGMLSAAAGLPNGVANPLTSNVSNIKMSVSVPFLSDPSVSNKISLAHVPANLNNCDGIPGGHSQNASLVQPQSGTVSSAIGTLSANSGTSSVMGSTAVGQGGMAAVIQTSSASQSQTLASAATGSRFRVVKLDSSSEQFKKGRWTCTQYYDKETSTTAVVCSSQSSHRAAESATCSERESTSGSSVSSTVSTLSHYTDSVGSGEMGGTPASQSTPQPQEYSSAPASQAPLPPCTSQQQVHSHPHDMVHSLLKPSVTHSVVLAGVGGAQQQASVHLGCLQTSMGQSAPAVTQQPLTYGQVSQTGLAQGLPALAPHQQMGFAPAPVQVVSPLAVQSQVIPGDIQAVTTIPSHMAHLSGSAPAVVSTGNGLVMAGGQQSIGSIHTAASQPLPSALLQQPPSSQAAVLPQMLPGSVSGSVQLLANAQPLTGQQVIEPQQTAGAQNLGRQISSGLVAPSVPSSVLADPQSSPAVQNYSNVGVTAGQVVQPVNSQYPALSDIMAIHLEDAQRLLFQHKALFSVPKASERSTSLEPEGNSETSALAATAGLLPLKGLPADVEDDSSSGTTVVAIDNKIEQAMDLVKSHLMYAVREEVEVLKEQIKELIERNSQLEQENSLLKNLASPEQLAQFQAQVQSGSSTASVQPQGTVQQSVAPTQSASATVNKD